MIPRSARCYWSAQLAVRACAPECLRRWRSGMLRLCPFCVLTRSQHAYLLPGNQCAKMGAAIPHTLTILSHHALGGPSHITCNFIWCCTQHAWLLQLTQPTRPRPRPCPCTCTCAANHDSTVPRSTHHSMFFLLKFKLVCSQ